ncbi:hypothetical protein AAGS61_06945 [Lysinibacillus sp. KU-BSD001]|uniref:hypothetical protein n=1 Tax=Lysinibacillus sp. KU-BSD001 TaxID=3141328 RepID=UPI0036E2C37B
MSRVFMLGFILSRMLNPLSYTVFILFFVMVSVSTGNIIPKIALQGFAEVMHPLYLPLLLMSILVHVIVTVLMVNFIYRVIVEGKYIVKLSTFGFLIALSTVQLFTYFCMNALPQVGVPGRVERQIADFVQQTALNYFELSSLLFMGLLLALYVGILGREKFKKNIGFIDDTLYE